MAILQHKCQMGLWKYEGMMAFCGVPQKIHFHLPFPFLFLLLQHINILTLLLFFFLYFSINPAKILSILSTEDLFSFSCFFAFVFAPFRYLFWFFLCSLSILSIACLFFLSLPLSFNLKLQF